jgi:hypothetical protein
VTLGRFLVIVVYVGYLVNAGLFMLLVPWSRAWGLLLTSLPVGLTPLLDSPWFRGMLSAFGLLHLLLVLWELVHPTILGPGERPAAAAEKPAPKSQNPYPS